MIVVRSLRSRRTIAWLLATIAVLLLAGGVARAGEWVQVSCTNPDGSAAPSEGWTGSAQGSPPLGSQANPRCSPQVPMQATLFDGMAAPAGAEELLQYAPPVGSTLIGGTLQVGLYADGYGSGSDGYTWGSAGVLEPGPQQTTANVVKLCTQSQDICQNGTDDYTGALSLPVDAGGDLYLEADCSGFNTSGACDAGGSQDTWALAELSSAQLLLRNDAVPQGTGFGGTLLARDATGDATLGFTASDPGGPGVYQVVAEIDGRPAYSGTPNDNDGDCRPVGTDAATGALMFDYQQPCPASEPVALTIPTAGLKDGHHALAVSVIDAAGNATQVLSESITTRNSGATHSRLRRLNIVLTVDWHWDGAHTTLIRAHVREAPRGAGATASCRGRGCPPGALRRREALRRLLRALTGLTFTAGDRLSLAFIAPGRVSERVRFTIRDGAVPSARRLR